MKTKEMITAIRATRKGAILYRTTHMKSSPKETIERIYNDLVVNVESHIVAVKVDEFGYFNVQFGKQRYQFANMAALKNWQSAVLRMAIDASDSKKLEVRRKGI